MTSITIALIASIAIIIYSKDYTGNEKIKKIILGVGLSILPIYFLMSALHDHLVTIEKNELAIIESKEKLSAVLESYKEIDDKELLKDKSAAKEITISPIEVLKIATLAEDGSFWVAEESLAKKYFTYSWFVSGMKKYDNYFRGTEFQRREAKKNNDGIQWIADTRTTKNSLYKANIEISFKNYNFKRQAFEVQFTSAPSYPHPISIEKYQGSGFSENDLEIINKSSTEFETIKFSPIYLSLFSDGRRRTDGAVRNGTSVFSTTFPEEHKPAIMVSEAHAKGVNIELFTIFATAYFDARNSSNLTHWGGLYLECNYMDVFTDSSRVKIYKTVPCNSLNNKIL